MRRQLFSATLLASAVGCALAELFFVRTGHPPDVISAALAALWLAMPYLGAIGLAAVSRKHTPALATLLVALLATSTVALLLYHASATQQETAEQQAGEATRRGGTRTAARRGCGRPGPTRGPHSAGAPRCSCPCSCFQSNWRRCSPRY